MILAIGIDVSKDKLDFYSSDKKHAIIGNDKASIQKHFKHIDKTARVVMEATGKYHRVAQSVLHELGFEVMIVNPYQSKHFSRAQNLLCKTDKVDAEMLCNFAAIMPFTPTLCHSQQSEELLDLSRHLDDLKKTRSEYQVRKKNSSRKIARSISDLIDTLDEEIKKTEKSLQELVDSDEKLTRKVELLTSIPGIGKTTAICLVSMLREMGTLSKREISALAGLAPVNNDSGKFSGKRRIRGGRHDVRRHLYMPIVGAATRHNPKLNVFYKRLIAAGKQPKVALTACMRKLVVWANAMLQKDQLWSES